MIDAFSLIGTVGLAVSVVATLAGHILNADPLLWLAWVGLGLYLIDAARHLGLQGRAFLAAALVTAGATLWRLEAPGPALTAALNRAIFIATLFAALGMLREAARTSEMVRRCGVFLANQPPGKRYAALTLGGHLFSIILNFGAIPLLGALTQRAFEGAPTDAAEADRARRREKRMMTAIQRGFVTTLCWSPLTVSLAVVLTALPETPWRAIAPWAIGSGLGLTVLGWALDRLTKLPPGVRPPRFSRPEGSWGLILPIAGLVGLVFVVGFAVEEVTGVRLVIGVMTAAPVIATAWLWVQTRDGAATGRRLASHVTEGFAGARKEVTILTSAAFIGSLIGALLPAELVAAAIAAVPLPAWGLVALLAWVIVAFGQVGMNPVLSVSAVAGALPAPAVLGLPPAAVAVALTGAWALTAASSPFSAATILVGQMTQQPAGTIGRKWNGPYVLIGLVLLTGWVGLVSIAAE